MHEALQPLTAAAPPRSALEVVRGLGLRDASAHGARPRVAAVMIASADGRAAVRGRSGGLGHPADRALLRALREEADVVLVGTGTLRAEGYANILDPDQRERRRAAGRPPLPAVATVSRSLDIPWQIGLFAEPDAVVHVYAPPGTDGGGDAGPRGATVAVHHRERLTVRDALEHLQADAGARLVVCEGGPTLLRAVVADGCLDDLLVTIAPLLVAGDEVRPLEGTELEPPVALELRDVLRAGSHVFLHYAAAR